MFKTLGLSLIVAGLAAAPALAGSSQHTPPAQSPATTPQPQRTYPAPRPQASPATPQRPTTAEQKCLAFWAGTPHVKLCNRTSY